MQRYNFFLYLFHFIPLFHAFFCFPLSINKKNFNNTTKLDCFEPFLYEKTTLYFQYLYKFWKIFAALEEKTDKIKAARRADYLFI